MISTVTSVSQWGVVFRKIIISVMNNIFLLWLQFTLTVISQLTLGYHKQLCLDIIGDTLVKMEDSTQMIQMMIDDDSDSDYMEVIRLNLSILKVWECSVLKYFKIFNAFLLLVEDRIWKNKYHPDWMLWDGHVWLLEGVTVLVKIICLFCWWIAPPRAASTWQQYCVYNNFLVWWCSCIMWTIIPIQPIIIQLSRVLN